MFISNLSFMQYGVKTQNGKINSTLTRCVFSHLSFEHKFVALMFFFDIDTILRINDYKSMRAKQTIKELALYLMRWQLSTPILAFCVVYLATFGEFWATVIANFIGGLIFFWVDRLIFKGGNNEKS